MLAFEQLDDHTRLELLNRVINVVAAFITTVSTGRLLLCPEPCVLIDITERARCLCTEFSSCGPSPFEPRLHLDDVTIGLILGEREIQ